MVTVATDTWIGPNGSVTDPGSGDFANAADWSTGGVPSATSATKLTRSGAYSVTSASNEHVRSLALSGSATLAIAGGRFEINHTSGSAPRLSVGADAGISIARGAILALDEATNRESQITQLDGVISVASGGELLFVGNGNEVVRGHGTIDLAAGSTLVEDFGFGLGVDFSGTVQGAGNVELGIASGGSFNLLDANDASAALTLTFEKDQSDSAEVSGTLEATSGGALVLGDPSLPPLIVFGSASQTRIVAIGAGSRVELTNVTVMGGALSTADGGVIETVAGGHGSLGGYPVSGGAGSGASNSGRVLVQDGTTLAVTATLTNSGTIALAAAGDTTTLRLESEADFVQNFRDTQQTRTITLAGTGSVTLTDDAANLIAPSRSTDILDNEGNVISGAGRIGGGQSMGLINRGVIAATGGQALTIDIGSGKATNGVAGVLKGSGAGGLVLAGGTYTNTGTIEARDGSTVTVAATATLTNDAGGTLTGGTYAADDTGHGATVRLGGGAVTTDAATIILSGAGSSVASGGASLEATLATIASRGKLEMLAGRDWTGKTGLTDDGVLQLGGGTFAASGLTVGSGGRVTGFGSVAAPVANDGLVDAKGALSLSGAVIGSGTLTIDGRSSLDLGGAVASSQTLLFGTGTKETAILDTPQTFAGTIKAWSYGDTIDLAGTVASAASIVGNNLVVDLASGGSLHYALSAPAANPRLVLAPDQAGGTAITLFRAAT